MAAIGDRDHAGDEGRAAGDGKTVGSPGINKAKEPAKAAGGPYYRLPRRPPYLLLHPALQPC